MDVVSSSDSDVLRVSGEGDFVRLNRAVVLGLHRRVYGGGFVRFIRALYLRRGLGQTTNVYHRNEPEGMNHRQ